MIFNGWNKLCAGDNSPNFNENETQKCILWPFFTFLFISQNDVFWRYLVHAWHSRDVDVAETRNSFVSSTTKSLGINKNSYILNKTINVTDPIESHPSILRINENVYMTAFTFNTITLEDVELEIRKMNPNKASTINSIPGMLRRMLISAAHLYTIY